MLRNEANHKVHVLKGFQIFIAPLLMLVLIGEPAIAQWQRTDYRDLQKVVLRELRETNAPGAAIAIARGGRVIYVKGFGTSNIETGPPVTPDMHFRV